MTVQLLPTSGVNQQNFNAIVDELNRLRRSGSSGKAPLYPYTGELWYDTANDLIKYYDNSKTAQTILTTATGGTVTSIDVSGGTTGLTASGGPITSSGTITLSGTLDIDNGGTGATTAGSALSALGGQPLDATLTALAAYNTNGLLTQTAADTFTGRTITAGSSKISISNGSGVSGNPTIDLGTVGLTDLATRAHSSLTSLTSGDDHTQYALLAGRSGGQTLQGDTASGGNLTLNSTAHATKGKILLGSNVAVDEVNTRVGIGTTSPDYALQIESTNFNTARIEGNMTQGTGTNNSPSLALREDDGSAMVSGNGLGRISFGGALDSSHTTTSGINIRAFATEDWSSTALGSRLRIYTIPNGSTTSISRVLIDQDGSVTFGTLGSGAVSASAGTISAGTLSVANGGTGQTSYTNGQLLIGNTTGNTLTKATLTAGSGIEITNGGGSITVGVDDDAWTAGTPAATGFSSKTVDLLTYKKLGNTVHCRVSINGTSNATSLTFTLPFTTANRVVHGGFIVANNGAALTTQGMFDAAAGTTTATCYRDGAFTTWTNTNNKYFLGQFTYETT